MESSDGIVDIHNDSLGVLRIKPDYLKWDTKIINATVKRLLEVRKGIGGGAGLAAPQIGISLPIFIYTSDRTDANLKAVINPSFEPIGAEQILGDEACFSVPLHMVSLPRWECIKTRYQDIKGDWVEEELTGFAAKVFQHEYAHLQGQLIIDHPEAKVEKLTMPDEFECHMKAVKSQDSKRY